MIENYPSAAPFHDFPWLRATAIEAGLFLGGSIASWSFLCFVGFGWCCWRCLVRAGRNKRWARSPGLKLDPSSGAHCGAFWSAARLRCLPPQAGGKVIPASPSTQAGISPSRWRASCWLCHCASQPADAARAGPATRQRPPRNCRTNGAMAMSARAQCSQTERMLVQAGFQPASHQAALCPFIRRVAFWIARGVLGAVQGLLERAIASAISATSLPRAWLGCSQLCGRTGPAPTT